MISKVIDGGFPKGLFNYVAKNDAEIIGGNMFGDTVSGLTAEFLSIADLNKYVKKPVKHHMLSFAKSDKVDSRMMENIASKYVRMMGYDYNQYFVIRHHDTDNEHLHIIINKVNYAGKSTHIPFEKKKSRETAQFLETEFNLTLTGKNRAQIRNGKKSYDRNYEELKRKRNRKGELTDKQVIEKELRKLIKRKRTWNEFKQKLKEKGIDVELNKAGNGITFELNGNKFKGSSIHRDLSFTKLSEFVDFGNSSISAEESLENREIVPESKPEEIAQSDYRENSFMEDPDGLDNNTQNDDADTEKKLRMKKLRKGKNTNRWRNL